MIFDLNFVIRRSRKENCKKKKNRISATTDFVDPFRLCTVKEHGVTVSIGPPFCSVNDRRTVNDLRSLYNL